MQEYDEKPILNVKGLKTYFHTEDGIVKAVDGVDFHVKPGEIVGLVGESGCGKTVTSLSILGLIPAPGKVCVNESIVGTKVVGMAGSNFGKVVDLINVSPYGQAVVIERELPPTNLLDIFMEGLAKQSIADLRFTIAKKLKIGEGAVFSSENLWAINNLERLLVSPHDILMSYYCILPASAFHISNQVKAKTGVYFHSISETL